MREYQENDATDQEDLGTYPKNFQIGDRVPKGNSHNSASYKKRVEWANERIGFDLEAITNHQIDPRRVRGVVENFVGAVQIPIGMVGPMQVNGDLASGMFVAPFATVEGVITLSASRGARVINDSGGIRTHILKRQMTRAPVFQFKDLDECYKFIDWTKANFETIKTECDKLSRHGKLEEIQEYIIGNTVHLKFCFFTSQAAGQNMVTVMTDNGTIWIRDHFTNDTGIPIRFYSVEGNIAGDKKINFKNINDYSSARGARVFTEVFLKEEAMHEHFNCTIEQFQAEAKQAEAGNVFAGTPGGFSVNAVNVIAAMYAATGQDLGCVYESGAQQNFWEVQDGGVYWSSTFHCIVTGTKSNASRLPTQNEMMKMLGCDGDRGAEKLAELIAAFAVSLDISTLASVANDTFSKAHRICGRG